VQLFCLAELVNGPDRYRHQFGNNLKSSSATGSESLTELLDGLILLYHVGVHKHYLKVNEQNCIAGRILSKTIASITLRDSTFDGSQLLKD
jgi:hypothetical protein